MEFINKDKLILRIHVGDVEDDEEVKSVSVLNDYSPIIEFKDGSKVAFSWQYLCNRAVEFKKQQQEEL
jgi:hypothetical protein